MEPTTLVYKASSFTTTSRRLLHRFPPDMAYQNTKPPNFRCPTNLISLPDKKSVVKLIQKITQTVFLGDLIFTG